MQTQTRPISLVAKDSQTGRLVWADNAKAILITLVALGHFSQLAGPLKTILYAFHLPAFLFLTGFFMSAKLRGVSFMDFCRKYIFPFARLYLFVTAGSVLLWWGAHLVLKQQFVSPVGAILNGLYGTQWQGHRFIHENGALWYLPFLVCSLLAFFVALRLPVWTAVAVIAALFCFAAFYTGYPLPWSAAAAGVGVAFIYAGFWFRILLENDRERGRFAFRRGTFLVASAASFVALVGMAALNGRTNLNLLNLGRHFYLYIPTAAAGILAIIAVSTLIPRTWLADELSANSLLIFCIHLYGVKAVNAMGLFAAQPLLKHVFLAVMAVVIVVVSMFLSRAAMPFINKWVMGRH